MKILIDACVLYPTVMREMVLGAASAGFFTPLWSARILDEWAHAAAKLGAGGELVARGEIALLQARWPNSSVELRAGLEETLYLPDIHDRHVLAAAISVGSDTILTLNAKDFPRKVLAEFGIDRRAPDEFLRWCFDQNPEAIKAVAGRIRQEAERLSGQPQEMRKLLKKARLPRLAKALA